MIWMDGVNASDLAPPGGLFDRQVGTKPLAVSTTHVKAGWLQRNDAPQRPDDDDGVLHALRRQLRWSPSSTTPALAEPFIRTRPWPHRMHRGDCIAQWSTSSQIGAPGSCRTPARADGAHRRLPKSPAPAAGLRRRRDDGPSSRELRSRRPSLCRDDAAHQARAAGGAGRYRRSAQPVQNNVCLLAGGGANIVAQVASRACCRRHRLRQVVRQCWPRCVSCRSADPLHPEHRCGSRPHRRQRGVAKPAAGWAARVAGPHERRSWRTKPPSRQRAGRSPRPIGRGLLTSAYTATCRTCSSTARRSSFCTSPPRTRRRQSLSSADRTSSSPAVSSTSRATR